VPLVAARKSPRYLARKAVEISLERDTFVDCTVRDFSPAGIGLLVPDTISLPAEFELTFRQVTQHWIAVWRHTGRMGMRLVQAMK
jgi:hypothetical protein